MKCKFLILQVLNFYEIAKSTYLAFLQKQVANHLFTPTISQIKEKHNISLVEIIVNLAKHLIFRRYRQQMI